MSSDAKRPTQAEVLEQLRGEVFQPQPVLELTALQVAGLFDELPAEAGEDVLAELEPDREGWSVAARRRWKLEIVPGVKVLLQPGYDLALALAELDRIRAELAARPELLNPDWQRPIVKRPVLRVVKARGE
jgi:hypothetical protein